MDKTEQSILTGLLTIYYPLPSEQLQRIIGECEVTQYKKEQHITESDKPDQSEYFLLDGIIHRYSLVEDGEFITTGFYTGPTVISPNFARTSHQKSIFSLQALVPSTVAQISVKKMDELRDADTHIRRWGQKVVEQELKNYFSHEVRFRSSNAKERLFRLREDYPNLENLIPQTCIASYVGITPVSLSRLRKELTK
jgi:CRP-like cAMP-binding protein